MKKILLTSIAITTFLVSFGQTCSELFFSEYVEGTGNDKGIEIYNPTGLPVDLSAYSVGRYSNGNAIIENYTQLSGTIAAYDVFVLINGQVITETNSPACSPALQALADQLDNLYPAPMYMNGNDAVALFKDEVMIDLIGKIGEDPGQSWTDVFPYNNGIGAYWTKDHTLIRKETVTGGISVNPSSFNVTSQWDSLPVNTWNNLGVHSCECGSIGINKNVKNNELSIYPNPSLFGLLQIESNDLIKRILLLNSMCQVISINMVGDVRYTLHTNNLPKGIYQIKVEYNNDSSYTSKVSVQ